MTYDNSKAFTYTADNLLASVGGTSTMLWDAAKNRVGYSDLWVCSGRKTAMALSEAASIQFPVSLDGKWHDYDLDMRANSRWNGRTDKLRLDPTDVAGSEFLIDEISFRK